MATDAEARPEDLDRVVLSIVCSEAETDASSLGGRLM